MVHRGSLNGKGVKPAIVASRFNGQIVEKLVEGAVKGFTEHGVTPKAIDVFWVPGALEIPLVAKKLAQSREYDCLVCAGCVIKGETRHFEYVAEGASSGLARVALETEIPILFSILLCDDPRQAWERAGGKVNRGREGALAALEMVNLLKPAGRRRKPKN